MWSCDVLCCVMWSYSEGYGVYKLGWMCCVNNRVFD